VATCRSYANDAQLGLDQPEEGPLPEAFLDGLCAHVQVHKRQHMAMQSSCNHQTQGKSSHLVYTILHHLPCFAMLCCSVHAFVSLPPLVSFMQRLFSATQDAFPGAAAKAAVVASLQGAAKAGRLAALLRSQLFMRRYEEDLAGRSQRLGQLARHW
jgi:hypothetical protein